MTGSKIIRLSLAMIVFKLLSVTCRGDMSVDRFIKHLDCVGHNGTDFILETFTDIAAFVCARKCKETPTCKMFFHNSRTCSLHSVYWENLVLAGKTAVDEGSACFIKDPRYSFVGCYVDDNANAILKYKYWESLDSMTMKGCSSHCNGYVYFGVRNGYKCVCDDVIRDESVKAPDSDCKEVCSGDKTPGCGGNARQSVYKN